MSKTFKYYANYYDILYGNKDYGSEVDYILEQLNNNSCVKIDKILELGCGTGGHAYEFNKRGYCVHGIDISDKMIEIAKRKLNSAANKNISFEIGDIKDFDSSKEYDAVVSLFHVVNYLVGDMDLEKLFRSVSKSLRKGGCFLFDSWYGPGVLFDIPKVRVKTVNSKELDLVRIAEPEIRVNDNIVDIKYTLFIQDNKSELYSKIEETHHMRYLFTRELQTILKSCGLKLIASKEWISELPLSKHSWHALFIVKKI